MSRSTAAAAIKFERPNPIPVLRKDLKKAAQSMTADEARYLVDLYYQMQDFRIASANQVREMTKSDEPCLIIDWVFGSTETTEDEIRKALNYYTDVEPTGMGRWCKSIMGIGPVISAGLIAHIDITKCTTVGSIWRFAGLDPTSKWEKGQKRPWNAELKRLCFLIGESFIKVSNKPKSLYGRLFVERRAAEIANNLAGRYAAQAADKLHRMNIGTDTEAYRWYSGCLTYEAAKTILTAPSEKRMGMVKSLAGEPGSGVPMLPPDHIKSRVRRWAVKVFLCHFFEEGCRRVLNKEPPLIYSIQMLGHLHKIEPENSKRRLK